MKIPFVDMKRMHDPIRGRLHEAALRVIDGGRYIGGPEVKGFEQEMAAYQGVDEICGASCGTMGAFSLLKAFGIGPGDEVITTVHTAIATAESISLTGAKVVFCDIKAGYFFLDEEEFERKITKRTKAVVPVHLYGQPAEMDSIMRVAKERNLIVIEDCAQAFGAKYGARTVGTIADAAVFSFFPSKNLGCLGDGGAVWARDKQVMKRVRMFSNHGREGKYYHEFEGINSRLDAIQAVFLRVMLPLVDEWNIKRRAAASWYDEGLAGTKEVTLPKTVPNTTPIFHVYVIVVPDRDALIAHLGQNDIETGVHYPYSLNVLPAYAHLNAGKGSFPRAEYACEHMLSLPMHPSITRDEVGGVCEAIRRFYGR